MALDIERIEWWVQAEAIKLKLKADLEKLRQIEESDKTFCREIKLKNQNNEQDNKTDHKD
jgi:hypothetical protein